MKKLNLLIIIRYSLFTILYSFTASAQNNTILSGTSLGFIFCPDYSNAVQLSGEMPKFAYTTGFDLNIKLNDKFSIETGLLFTDQGYKEHLYNTNQYPVYNPGLPSNIKNTYNDHYIEVPVDIQYYVFRHPRLSGFVEGGISLNYLIYSTTISENYFANGSSSHTRTVDTLAGTGFSDRFEIGGNIGFGLNYKLKDNLYLTCEPVYRYYIAPFSDFAANTKLNTIGLNVGIFYTFKSGFKPLPK